MPDIPLIDIAPLFDGATPRRDAADQDIARAAFDIGFMVVVGHPAHLPVGAEQRANLLKLFELKEADQRPFWKRNFAPENTHIYRGWFPLASSAARNREGFEIGPDILRPLPEGQSDDLLYEPTPLPDAALLPPGWRQTAAEYYDGMEQIGHAILASLSRSLKIDPAIFRDAFRDGISTLRLLHYPKRPDGAAEPTDVPERYTSFNGKRYEQIARAHVDSGLLTVLAQCGVGGLQAQNAKGDWVEVPVIDNAFSINFGGLLERWTGGRIRATNHRVLGRNENRFSVPFFFEPRPNTVISPLPLAGITPFAPFQYGDHLWATTTKFPENFGLGHLRPARAPYQDPMAP